MIYEMLRTDVLRFMALLTVFLMAFSQVRRLPHLSCMMLRSCVTHTCLPARRSLCCWATSESGPSCTASRCCRWHMSFAQSTAALRVAVCCVPLQMSFFAMLGGFEFDDMMGAEFPTVYMFLLIVYVVVVSIMLLNLLIAMMVRSVA